MSFDLPGSSASRALLWWNAFCNWITSTGNRLYIGWFGVLMIPTGLAAATCFVLAFVAAPAVDMDGIREPIVGSILGGNSVVSAAVMPTSAAIGLHFIRFGKPVSWMNGCTTAALTSSSCCMP